MHLRTFLFLLLAYFAVVPAGVGESPPADEAAPLVVVAGASGRTGHRIVRELLQQGYRVRALSSDVERARERFDETWDWAEADVRDPAAVDAAIQGATFVICAIGARTRTGPDGPEFVDYGGVRNIVDAARANGVKQMVLISSAAAGPFRKRSRMIEIANIREWKTRGELYLKSSGLAYTIIGPGGLEDRASTDEGIRLLTREDYQTGQIPTGDVARVAVAMLNNEEGIGKTFAAIRDASLAAEVWREMVADLPLDLDSAEAVAD